MTNGTHTTTRRNDVSGVLQLDPGELYWGVLRSLGAKADHDTLRYAFERYLPLPVDEVECRFLRVPHTQSREGQWIWIACGIEREALGERLEECADSLESVHPSSLPEFLGIDETRLEQFEFRTGEFTSPRVRKHRRRLAFAAIVTIVGLSGLVSAGYLISADRLVQRVKAVTAQTEFELRDSLTALELLDPNTGSNVHSSLILASQLRKAERTRVSNSEPESTIRARVAAPAYVMLLTSWPGDLRTAVDSVQITGKLLTITGALADAGDWERLRDALTQHLDGWSEQGASVNRADERYRFSIRFERESEGEVP